MSRLLFVSYSGVLGGAERALLDFASGLPGESLIACPDGALASAARADGVPVLILPPRNLALRAGARGRLRAAVALAGHARDLRRLEASLDPDLTVAWGMRSAIAGLGGRRRQPVVFAHHDFIPGPLIAVVVRAAARRAVRVIVPSDAVARELDPRGRLRGRLHVVHPGVVPESFTAPGEPASPPEVLVLGALTGWKRPDLALEAIALARSRVPELRLRLVGAALEGETELIDRLRARAAQPDLAGAVELAGFARDPRAALARATCLLHCAPREPFGLAVLESLAAGRPAVVPASCGPAEIVDDRCGVLYAPGDAGAAAAALVDLLSDPARAAAMGRRGRERARGFDRNAARARFRSVIGGVAPPEPPLVAGVAPLPAQSLAIVTVTHNSARELQALLGSVDRHLAGARVVVVDSGSGDASAQVAREHPGVTLLELGENVGFGRACNRGLGLVSEPVVALLNPDVEVIDDSLLVLAAQAARADLGERLLAPRVLNADGSLQDTAHPLPGSTADLVRSLVPPALVGGRAGEALAPWRSDRPRRVGWAVGCALVARADTLRALGPFDESLFLYGEDMELGLRAARAGVPTWLWPGARVVHHRAHSSTAAFGGEPFERLARARHEVVARSLGRRRAALDDALQLVTFATRVVGKGMLGRPGRRERAQLRAVLALRHVGPVRR